MALSIDFLSKKVNELESKYDGNFKVVFDALRKLLDPPQEKPKRELGFKIKD